MTIVDRIRALANGEGMSLPNLEEKLGLGNGTISRWRTGSPSSDKLTKIADHFNVSIDYLLGRDMGSEAETKAQKKVKIMTRKAEEHLTEEESEQLAEAYANSIEMFLKAKGIKENE